MLQHVQENHFIKNADAIVILFNSGIGWRSPLKVHSQISLKKALSKTSFDFANLAEITSVQNEIISQIAHDENRVVNSEMPTNITGKC